MKNSLFILALLLFAMTGGCNIDIITTSIPEPDQLTGSWSGTMQDGQGAMHLVTLSFNRKGEITRHLVDGVETGRRGYATGPNSTGTLFALKWNDGTLGGILTNREYTHAAFLDQDFIVGSLEKNAAAYLPYTVEDIIQPFWSGHYLLLDGDFNFLSSGGALLEVALDRRFNGTDGDGRVYAETAVIDLTDSFHGRYEGAYQNEDDASDAGPLVAFLTPDKTHAAAYTCSPDETGFPDGCRFYLFNK
ncbi:MAG: hypothetical protein IIC13_12975 [SAR324 cluster bacterium]|nr:hypothetical protein [SAR324 cluster bacterium]MCH8887495.1 hypothetical protein [SAR324 cluster bacterium]